MAKNESNKDDKENAPDISAMLGMGGFLDGVSNLISKFGDLAERGEQLRKSMGDAETTNKPIRTSGAFTVRFGGLGGDSSDASSVTPVNTRTSEPKGASPGFSQKGASPSSTAKAASPAAREIPKDRTANVEVFEEEDHVLLLAEMPGVASEDVDLNFEEQSLHIQGASKTANFKATVELPRKYTPEQVTIHANNGVIEIHLANN